MESQVVRPHGHHDYDQETHTTGMHGQAEHDHGGHHDIKPAVIMKKVKDKAKKVKDKIKKHSHLHGHDHDHDEVHGDEHHNSDYRDSDEDERDEELVESPEVHGAPIYDSEKTRTEARQTETWGHTGTNVERPTNPTFVGQGKNAVTHSGEAISSIPGNSLYQATNTNSNRNLDTSVEGSPGLTRLNLDRPVDLEVDSAAPKSQTAGSTASNYQSKVSDPTTTGGQEIGTTTPIDQSLKKMSIADEESQLEPTTNPSRTPEVISKIAPTGSHDQFSPELAPPRPHNTEHLPKISDANQPHDGITQGRPSNQESYTPTLENPQRNAETYDANKPRDQENQGSYTSQISSAISALADKAVMAKDVAASKLGYGGERGDAGVHGVEAEKLRSYDNTKLSQGDQSSDMQPNQSGSYTGKISSVAAAIPAAVAGTALSAKNVVASKLGYGKEDDDTHKHQIHAEEQQRSLLGSGAEHDRAKERDQGSTFAGKISSAAAAIPAAVTGTAVSAKNVVASKLGYGPSTQEEKQNSGPKSTTDPETRGITKEQDKGLSMKGYISEKLKPGDGDRALSELLSETLHLQKKDPGKEKQEEKPMGKVTESEEVAKRLGTEEDKSAEKVQSMFINAPGETLVDKVKGAVGSWLGGGDVQNPQHSESST